MNNEVRKVYLCDSEDIHDIATWKVHNTKNKAAKITKAELLDLVKCQNDFIKKGATPSKSDSSFYPSGNSWSATLQRNNYPARWITYRGNRVLIKLNSDGTGTVVFSANPSMEHLKIIPKTHEEYKKIQSEKDKKKEHRRVKEKVTDEDVKEARERTQKVKKESQSVKESLRERYAEILGRSKEDVEKEDIEGLEKKIEDKAKKTVEREDTKKSREEAKKAVMSLFDDAESMGEKMKSTIEKAIEETAEKKIADEILEENGFLDDDNNITTGDEEVDKKLSIVRGLLNYDDAIDILSAREQKKKEIKSIKEKYKDEVDIPKGNVEITSLQGVAAIDWEKDPEMKEDVAIEAALKSVESQNRAKMNTEFYKAFEEREGSKSTQKEMAKGVKDTMNAIAGQYLEGKAISKEAIEFMGNQNASRLIAGAIANEGHEIKDVVKDLEKHLDKRSSEVVSEVVDTVKTRMERKVKYKEQSLEGMLAPATAAANGARQVGYIGRELGMAVGSLEAAATVLDSLKDVSESQGDIVVNGGKNIANIQDKMENFGLSESDYFTKKSSDGSYQVTIKNESFDKMLSKKSIAAKRDKVVEDIKTGKAIEGKIINEKMGLRDWRPMGTEATFVDFKSSPKEGYEEYVNRKGERGYTSEFKEGTKLYGKDIPIGSMDAQQKAIKFAESQKRVVWNLGAGTGKTFSYLGVISQLKEKGKLENFAVVSPPSRLRKEFLKDTEKFFPHMKVKVLDDAKDMDAKMQMIKDAKDGKIDILISGHDSVKMELSTKHRGKLIREHVEEKYGEWAGKNQDASSHEKGKKKKEFQSEGMEKYGKYGIPDLIAEAKPSLVAVDEAHEVFKAQDTKDSRKFAAIKDMQKNAEYVINGTGTTVRNNIKELGNLLHITNPNEVPSASAFGKKYEGVNQHSTVFQSQSAEAMARESDNVMISESLKLKPKNFQRVHKSDLTESQKKRYSQSEEQYHLDRKGSGFGIVDTETGNFIKDGAQLKSFEELPFNPSKDIKKMSPKEKSFLKQMGLNHAWTDKEKEGGYKVVKLGGSNGAAQRKQSRHEKIINGGDYKENGKAQQMVKNINSARDKKHIIFYERHASRNMLNDMLKGMGFDAKEAQHIHGRLGASDRKKAVTEFQTKDGVKFMLASEAGMTGLNMQKGDHQHFLTRSNTYAKQLQAVARSYRTGREEDVVSNFYDSNTVVDDNKVDAINRKKKMTESVREVDDKLAKVQARLAEKRGLKKGLYIKI